MSRIHPNFLKHELPIAGVLNRPQVRENRSLSYKGVRLHVSDLIKTDAAYRFCEREHVIKNLFKPTVISGALPASFDLLFDLGNTLHDNARNRWMRYSKNGKKAVLARWHCYCHPHTGRGATHKGVNPEAQPKCSICQSPPIIFDEYEFVNKDMGIIAHPDFTPVKGKSVIRSGEFDKTRDTIHLVEIKGIDRIDLDWDTLDGPLGEHTLQGSMYYWIGRMDGYKISDQVSYLYGDRAVKKSLFRGTPWKEFIVPVDPFERVNKFFDKARKVMSCVKEEVVPARTICTSDDCPRAKNCALATLCFSLPSEEHDATAKKATRRNPQKETSNKVNGPVVFGSRESSGRVGPKPLRHRISRSKRR